MRVRNKGKANYLGRDAEVHAGAEAEVTDAVGTYLLSDECPGEFEEVKAVKPAVKPDAKDKK